VQTASLLKHFIDERAEVRLVLGDDVGPLGSGLDHLYKCLRRLALVKPETGAGLSEPDLPQDIQSKLEREATQHDYAILLTAAAPGSIPAAVWRTSHVIYL